MIAGLCAVLVACGGGDEAPLPPAPVVQGRLAVPGGRVHGLAAQGTLVHVAAGFDGLLAVDVSDLSQPRIVGGVDPKVSFPPSTTTALDNVLAVAADDRVVVLAVSPGCVGLCLPSLELRVFDLSAPRSPKLLATLSDGARSIALSGKRLYALRDGFGVDASGASTFGRLEVIDLADPTRPQTMGSLDVAAVGAMAIDGNRLAIAFSGCASGGSSAQVIDIANAQSLKVVASAGCRITSTGPAAVAFGATSLYSVHGEAGLVVHDLLGSAFASTRWPLPTVAQGVDRFGSTLYVTQQAQGIALFDLTLPLAPNAPKAALTTSQVIATRAPAVGVRVFDGVGIAVTDASDKTLSPAQGLEFFRPRCGLPTRRVPCRQTPIA